VEFGKFEKMFGAMGKGMIIFKAEMVKEEMGMIIFI
jgi:hypothetical protein